MSLSKIGLLTAALLCCGVSAPAQEVPKEKEVKKPAAEREVGEPRREGGDRAPRADNPGGQPRREDGEPGRPPRREGEGEGARPPRGEGEDGPRAPRREGGEGRPPRDGEEPGPRFRPGAEEPGFNPRGPRPGGEDGPRQPQPGMGIERDPKMQRLINVDMELERVTRGLADSFRRASAEEREKMLPQIAEVVTKHFTIRQERREYELKRLEEQLQKLRESIAERTKSREAIIKRRIAELTGDRDDMGF